MKDSNNVTKSIAHTTWNCKYHIVSHLSTGEKYLLKRKG